jgi:signal transduction histidine kinase
VRFTADASHELRTPISVILTQIQLALSRERSPEEYRKTLETCGRAAERMRVLVNQLLELARVDSGEFSLLKEKCDLSRIARESLDLLEPLAMQRNVKLKHALEPVMIRGDALKLGQVIINLLNNAIHHNPEGTEISLSVQQSDSHATIKVKDTGAGIPPEALPHIFDRFYRVDKSRARGKGNSGLGLAISKAIIDVHDGTIRAESEVGKGTEFVIVLPLNRNLRSR